jgi:putative transposase
MNSICERFLDSVRRECLDHIVVLGEPNLEYALKEYGLQYFNTARAHQGNQGIGQRAPSASLKARTDLASVIAVSVLGWLHHDYRAAG